MIKNLETNVISNSLVLNFESEVEPEILFTEGSNCKWDITRKIESECSYQLNVDIRTYNYLEVELFINDYQVHLDKYYLDESKFYDDFYMTETLINASARNLSPDEIFFVGLAYIRKIPSDSPYLGALITLLSYRVLDDINERAYLFDAVYEQKKLFDSSINATNPHSIRWFISSASTFTMLALTLGKVDVGYIILKKLQEHSHLAEFNPLSYWNYCQAMTLLGLIHVDRGDKKEAGTIFITTFIFSRNSLIDIYNPRNDWLLGQLSDCTAILELGKLCLISGTKCFDNKIPSSSRVCAFNANDKEVNLSPLFIRFRGLKLENSNFFNRVKAEIVKVK